MVMNAFGCSVAAFRNWQCETVKHRPVRSLAGMSAESASLIVSAGRRMLSVVLCALMLMLATIPIDSGFYTGSVRAGQVSLVAPDNENDNQPATPDALLCHSAHHLCGKLPSISPAIVAGIRMPVRPRSAPALASPLALFADVSNLPTRPPRA
ncbi:Hypothetical protein RMP42_05807 (plasmid) [Roseomonas mucosa]|nr:Hypothetical protein RMP42_05807 [Roseomonas mucosa]